MFINIRLAAYIVGLIMVAHTAHATTISLVTTIDLDNDGRVITFGNQQSWEGIVSIDPFSVVEGDTLSLLINFSGDRALLLADADSNALPQLTKLTLFYDQPSQASWLSTSTYTYLGTHGDLLQNSITETIVGSGQAIRPFFFTKNLTDTSFSYTSILLETTFDAFQLESGSPVISSLEWSSSSQSVRIIDIPPIPLPKSLPLFLAALSCLVWVAKGSYRKVNSKIA